MVYQFVRLLARITLKISFRKIFLHQVEKVPQNEAVILAANHPTAFAEPCILAAFLPRPIWFLVRGDMFANPIFARLMKSLHMVPIYRLKDGGYKNLKNNFGTLQFCYDQLKRKKQILILAEGTTIHEKRLRPLKKGTARLAFGTLEQAPELDLFIVPVGVNYSHADRFRGDAMLNFGEPIRVQDYWPLYQENPQHAIRELTQQLKAALSERVIHIENPIDDELVERLLTLYRNNLPTPPYPVVEYSNEQLENEMAIADWVNTLSLKQKAEIEMQTQQYFYELNKKGLSDAAIAPTVPVPANWWMWLGRIPALIGYALNWLPRKIILWLGYKKVKVIEFRLSVMMSAGIGIYLIYLFLLGVGGTIVQEKLYWLGWLLVLPLGYLSLRYYEDLALWHQKQQAEEENRTELSELRAALVERALPEKSKMRN